MADESGVDCPDVLRWHCPGIRSVCGLDSPGRKDGRLTVLAGTGDGTDFVSRLCDSELRWGGDSCSGLPVEAVIRHGYRQIIKFSDTAGGLPRHRLWHMVRPRRCCCRCACVVRHGVCWRSTAASRHSLTARRFPSGLGQSPAAWALPGIGPAAGVADLTRRGPGRCRQQCFHHRCARRHTLVNRSFVELSGYSAEQLLGQNPKMLSSGVHGVDFYRRFGKPSGREIPGAAISSMSDRMAVGIP